MNHDELGPEAVVQVYDAASGMTGYLVIDNSVLGPTGGGCRMSPMVTADEVAALARGMTYKFAIFQLPRGGCKSGIVGDPSMPAEQKREWMRAFGRCLGSFLARQDVAVGPDMGVTIPDVEEVYRGAGLQNVRSGLFTQVIDNDAAGYHFTGFGVVCAAQAGMTAIGRGFAGASIAIEGFGQVGTGAARYAAARGAKIVAVSTVVGAIYDPAGLDVPQLLTLRREHGDACVLKYGRGERLTPIQLYSLPVDVLVPGARPNVLNGFNSQNVRAKLVCPAANIAVTEQADDDFLARGVVCVPHFISNAGGMLSSLVDIFGGTSDDAFAIMDRLIPAVTTRIVTAALAKAISPTHLAHRDVRGFVQQQMHEKRPTFAEARARIRDLLLGGAAA